MIRFFLFAIFAMIVVAEPVTVQGQGQSSRRGRFMQRIREDVFGAQSQAPSKQPNNQTGQVPTPAKNQNQPPGGQGQLPAATSVAPAPNRIPALGNSSRTGFGFNVAVNDKSQLLVSGVDRTGNAAEAGIRQGDRVIEIGGIESNTVEEFDQIVKVMQSGDQMEFKISRGGDEQKVMVQFGRPSTPDQAADQTVGASEVPLANANANSDGERRYDFAPPARISPTSRSVLDGPPPSNPYRAQPVSQKFSDQADVRQVQQMQRTIASQNQEIQKLQREVEQMRRAMRSR